MAATVFEHLVLVKSEVTKGTDAVPTAATNALRVTARATPTVNRANVDRTVVKQTMGNLAHLPDPDPSTQVTIECELKGSGTAGTAPDWGPLMKACRMVETVVGGTSVTYLPSTATEESATIYVYIDGVLWKLLGAVGTCAITANPGELPKATFTMSAPYAAPVATAVPAGAAFDTSVPHVVSTTDVVSDGVSINVGAFAIDLGNDVQEHKVIGSHEFVVANRAPTLTITKDSVSTAAEWTAVHAGTNAALSGAFNGGAGNIVTISAPVGRRQSVAYGERAERFTQEVVYNLYESASDDQISIALT